VAGRGPRRRVTTGITLVILAVVLCVMGFFGVKQALKPFPSGKSSSDPTCSATKQVQKFLTRHDVQISVFNAGNRSGLASETLDKVEAAGFVAGNAGNAPGTAEVRRAVVWTTKPDDYSAKLAALAFGPGTQVVVTKTDLGPGVDVLVGNRFHGLDKKAATRIKLPRPVETCVTGS
jgi:LytR cell envelope-related transcriptional attenuator